MQCLGIDIGSTSIKGAVLDLARRRVGESVSYAFPAPLTGLPAGWVEIDPRAVRDTVRFLIEELLTLAPEAERLYCSGQMGGLILTNAEGRALSNYLSWRDQRTLAPVASGETFLDAMRARWEAAGLLNDVGGELAPGSATTLLAWLHAHGRLPDHATFATIADYTLGRLIGQPIPMHATHALGMLDLQDRDWHDGAFESIGWKGLWLPKLSRFEEPVGQLTLGGRTLDVYGSFGDQQCALRGAGLQSGELSLNISTGSQVSCRTSELELGSYQTRCYFFGDYLNTVTHLPAGRSLNVLVDLLTELAREQGVTLTDPWQTIHRLANGVPATDLQVDLAFFRGPLGSHGRIDGITTENFTVGHLFQAAFRSMADNYLEVSRKFTRNGWHTVVLSGGLTQSAPLLRHYLQQCFPMPIRESAGEETLLGLLEIGLCSDP
jgi:sugar (pentulose or hexulose) kinase